ncbi:MAG: sortase [Pseudomonadales bacterium]|nr:sortase [Pseudomonadales bacterium]
MKTKLVTTTIGFGLLLFGLSTLSYSYGPIIFSETSYFVKNTVPIQIKKFTEKYSPELFNAIVQGDAPKQIQYFFNSKTVEQKEIEPVDTNFGIVISKIDANAPIVAKVDPFDANIYQRELAKGVAQAAGTGLPGQEKTMFLFAHASGDITMARRYNSIFYLLNKMEAGDEIKIYYKGAPYIYKVTQTKEVSPEAVSFLENNPDADLILMTCTPPGTTWRRLLVLANLESVE